MSVARAIINKIGKDIDVDAFEVPEPVFSPQLLPLNDILERFSDKVLAAYRSKTATHGCFEENTDNFPFSTFLENYTANKTDDEFMNFSQRATSRLHAKIKSIYKASAEYIIFLDYSDLLLVVILNNALGTSVNPDFTLCEVPNLKIDSLHHAAKINITKWQDQEERYLSFISKREEGANYFQGFIGGTSLTNDRRNTKNLQLAIKEYCASVPDLSGRVDDYINDAHSFLSRHIRNNRRQEISVDVIARRIFPEHHENFIDIINQYEIDSNFIINGSELRKFKRLYLKGHGYTFSFDKDLVTNGTLHWEADSNVVKIKVDEDSAEAINNFLDR